MATNTTFPSSAQSEVKTVSEAPPSLFFKSGAMSSAPSIFADCFFLFVAPAERVRAAWMSPMQKSLVLAAVVRHGGTVLNDELATVTGLMSQIKSLERKLRKHLYIVSPADGNARSVAELLVTREHPGAPKGHTSVRASLATSLELSLVQAASVVSCVRPEYISSCVAAGNRLPVDKEDLISAGDLANAFLPRNAATSSSPRSAEIEARRNNVVSSMDKYGRQMEAADVLPSTADRVVTTGGGFISIFFGEPKSSISSVAATSISADVKPTKRMRRSSSSDDEHDRVDERSLRRVHRPRSVQDVEWITPADEAVKHAPAPLAPTPFADLRKLAFIDRTRPFVCQKHRSAAGSNKSSEESGDGGGGDDDAEEVSRQTTSRTENLVVAQNQPILDELAALMSTYEATGDQWRKYAYSKAIGAIKRLSFKIERAEDLRDVPGIGKRILEKISQIIASGTSVKLQVLRSREDVSAMEALVKIWGVGPSTAKRITQHRIFSLPALRSHALLTTLLTPVQLAGLRHYEDLLERIPRGEVELIEQTVREALAAVIPSATRRSQIDLVTCGSYRRGRATSGDVDILICDRHSDNTSGLLQLLVHQLSRSGASAEKFEKAAKQEVDRRPTHPFVVEELTTSFRSMNESHSDTWLGIVQLPDCSSEAGIPSSSCPCIHRPSIRMQCVQTVKDEQGAVVKQENRGGDDEGGPGQQHLNDVKVKRLDDDTNVMKCRSEMKKDGHRFDRGLHLSRRLDIKVYPAAQFPFAVLYFTGSDYFNRSMRLYAQKRGLALSDKELKPVIRIAGDRVHETSHGIMCRSERDVFDALGLPYKDPRERDV